MLSNNDELATTYNALILKKEEKDSERCIKSTRWAQRGFSPTSFISSFLSSTQVFRSQFYTGLIVIMVKIGVFSHESCHIFFLKQIRMYSWPKLFQSKLQSHNIMTILQYYLRIIYIYIYTYI